MDTISVSFPVNPCPDVGAPVNRHRKSPIDAKRALIGLALVLMTLNPFERVGVSLKLVSMLLSLSATVSSTVNVISNAIAAPRTVNVILMQQTCRQRSNRARFAASKSRLQCY